MNGIVQDLRFALRALRKNLAFTAVAVLTLGLGVGASTTIYTWLQAMVLRPFPLVREPDRLVLMSTRSPGGERWNVSYPDLVDLRRESRTLKGIVGYSFEQVSLRIGEEPAERAWSQSVTANYFDVLGIRPALGRLFRADEDSVPGAAPIAVLGYVYWQRHFAADAGVVGRTVSLNGHPFTIVGVAPARFGSHVVGVREDLWVPASMDALLTTSGGRLTDRGLRSYHAFGRLAEGATLLQVQRELRAIGARQAATYREDENLAFQAEPFGADGPSAWFGPILFAALGLTGVVLLIACANVANLFLSRAVDRRKEMAIRLALGARRAQIVRLLLVESLVVALLSGSLGLLLAAWGSDLLSAVIPVVPVPIDLTMHLDASAVGFTFIVSLVTVFAFGLLPALDASRPQLVAALKDSPGVGIGGRGQLRAALVVAQVALSVVALVSGGLFLRSLGAARSSALGFRDPEHVLLIDMDLHLAGYTRTAGWVFHRQLLERVAALPGVRSASLAEFVPLGFGGAPFALAEVDGYSPRRGEDMSVQDQRVAPGYFATMGTRLLHGRDFAANDDSAAAPVIVVNDAFARRYWPRAADAIGRRVKVKGEWRSVVGVVATAPYNKLAEPELPFLFFPFAQRYGDAFTLHVRTTGDPHALIEPARRLVTAMDVNVPFLDARTLRDHMGGALLVQRMGASMLGMLGALALLLSSMGIYSVVAYTVSQRARELGIRTALGAGRRDILELVVGDGMRVVLVGIGVGVLAAFGVAILLRSQLYGIGAADPVTFVGITLLIALVALVANYVPARRAARVSPLVALRQG